MASLRRGATSFRRSRPRFSLSSTGATSTGLSAGGRILSSASSAFSVAIAIQTLPALPRLSESSVVIHWDCQHALAFRTLRELPDGDLRRLDALDQARALFRPVTALGVED